jgi:hypothetical protein
MKISDKFFVKRILDCVVAHLTKLQSENIKDNEVTLTLKNVMSANIYLQDAPQTPPEFIEIFNSNFFGEQPTNESREVAPEEDALSEKKTVNPILETELRDTIQPTQNPQPTQILEAVAVENNSEIDQVREDLFRKYNSKAVSQLKKVAKETLMQLAAFCVTGEWSLDTPETTEQTCIKIRAYFTQNK